MNDDLNQSEVLLLEGNPLNNKDAILIVRQPDGNYRGFMVKHGKLVQARQADPTIVLQMLITHE